MLEVAVVARPSTLVTVNVAELLPDAIVTVEGTVATPGILLARLITMPFVGAGLSRVTVLVEVAAEAPVGWLRMLAGFNVTD
jgi:hypothetical protein